MVESSLARFERLQSFLAVDPGNALLRLDAADAALMANAPDEAAALLEGVVDEPQTLRRRSNLAGMIALKRGQHEAAEALFGRLLEDDGTDPAVRYNRSYALAMLGRTEDAEALLDDPTVAAVPAAAALKVRMLHHLGDTTAALAWGQPVLAERPDDHALAGALSAVAMDEDDTDTAAALAAQGGDDGEALTTRGALLLAKQEGQGAAEAFARAIAINPGNGRAWLGQGLTQLGQQGGAAAALDRAAELFKHHVGTWVAAGWAHLIEGDARTARERFETVVALDESFAEGHGGLAVLDAMAGDIAKAERGAAVALRLDRESFSGALATSLLRQQSGDAAGAERVRARAMAAPVGLDGATLGELVARFGLDRTGLGGRH